MNASDQPKGPQSKKWGRLAWATIFVLIGHSLGQIREPTVRADAIKSTIRPGMLVTEVEHLLRGRYYCFYEIETDGRWGSVPRAQFDQGAHSARRLMLTFMSPGGSPGRVSFSVEISPEGTVTKTSPSRSWD